MEQIASAKGQIRKLLILFVAIVSIVYSVYIVITTWPSLYYSIQLVPHLISEFNGKVFLALIITFFTSLVIPSLILFGGFFLLLFLKIGKVLLLVGYIFDFLLRLIGVLNIGLSYILNSKVSHNIEGEVVQHFYIWPSYLIIIIEIFLIYLLIKRIYD